MNSSKLAGVLAVIFALAFVVALGFAISLNSAREDLKLRLDAARQAAAGREEGVSSTDVRDDLARKDATIRQLRQQVESMKTAGRPSAPGVGEKKPSPVPRAARSLSSQPAAAPPDAQASRVGLAMPAEPLMGTFAEQSDYFANMDTSYMTEEQLAVHNSLVKQFAEMLDLMDRAEAETDPVKSESLGREMSAKLPLLNSKLRQERSILLQLAATELGYDNSGGREFVDNMQYIGEMTSGAGTFQRLRAHLSRRAAR